MLKYILFVLSLVIIANSAQADTVKLIDNDSLLKVYLTTKRFEIDTNAKAIVLYEKALADITIKSFSDDFYQRLEYTVEKCFKIIDKEALDLAQISIPYTADLKVKDVSVYAINLENGMVIKSKVTRGDVLKEKISDGAKVYKFNLPNIQPGSIIYYTYTYKTDLGKSLVSDYFPVFWTFQNDYPTLESRLELKIPSEVNFNAIVKNTSFKEVSTREELERNTHTKLSSVADPTQNNDDLYRRHITWKRNNIEALTNEDFIINPESKQEKINIYISSYFPLPYQKRTKPVYDTWAEANDGFFYKQRYLGGLIFHPQDTLSFILNKIISGEKENLSLAKAIYKYVRDSISCTGYSRTNRVWSSRSPLNAYIQKKGTSSDKNILLAALYRKAGLKSFPIVLSTTDNEKITAEHFEPDALNHLITVVMVDSALYYLDPSYEFQPFGVLKPNCYNEFAWLINEKGLPISMNADDLQDKNICMATLKPTDKKGTYSIKIDQRLGNVSGSKMRTLWAKDSVGMQKLLDKNINQLKYKTKITGHSLINIYNPDTPLIISYNLELELDQSGDYIYLNPFFKRIVENNPFKDVIRKYPVEFENAVSSQFILKFQLPEGYTLEDPEGSINLNFNNGAMVYNRSMLYDPKLRIFSLNSALQSKTTKVAVEDYKELRSFYEAMVTDQNKSIVLKKIN